MNAYIVTVDKSSHPNEVYIKVLDPNTKEQVPTKTVDGKTVIYVNHDDKENHDLFGEESMFSSDYILELVVPPDLKDLQYVMDVAMLSIGDDEEADDDENRKILMGKKMHGLFTSNSRGCGDTRAHGRSGDAGLEIKVKIPSSALKNKDGDQGVEVTAGWACGHEPVKLTHPVTFLPMPDSSADGDIPVPEKRKNSDEKAEEIFEDGNWFKNEDDARGVGKVSEKRMRIGKEAIYEEQNQALNRMNVMKNKLPLSPHHISREEIEADQIGIISKDVKYSNKRQKEELKTPMREFRKRYEEDSFGQASFSTKSYLIGCSVMLILGGSVIKFAPNFISRRTKGRRDL